MRTLALLLLLGSCSKERKPGEGAAAGSAAAGAGAPARAAVLSAWRTGGLEPSALTAAQVPVGTDCQSGTVGGVDVLLCVYATPAAATAAEAAGLAWVGAATGLAQARGTVLVAAADRRKADPSGRTLNQLVKLAPPT